MPLRNLLLDRDGTVIEDRHYLSDPEGVSLLPGVGPALGRLARAGVRLFLVTNQSGIGRGYFSLADYEACQARLAALLAPYGVAFVDVACCPHAPDDACTCRKPLTGMWDVLRARHGLVPAETVMVGDKLDDVRFARNAGLAAGILVLTGKGEATAREHEFPLPPPDVCLDIVGGGPGAPDVIACDLGSVADWLLAVAHGEEPVVGDTLSAGGPDEGRA